MASAEKEILSIENRIAVVREYALLWQKYFAFFSEDLSEKTFTQEQEQEFQQIVSLLALNQYKLQVLAGNHMKDSKKVLNVLEETVSLDFIKHMQAASFSKLQVEWHTLFLAMNKALGRLLAEVPPKQLEEMQRKAGATS